MAEGGEATGLSAAGARKITRRVEKIRMIAPPAKYTVTDSKTGVKHEEVAFKTVSALCPKIKSSTLKRRLENGERDLAVLRRRPETKQQAHMRRLKK